MMDNMQINQSTNSFLSFDHIYIVKVQNKSQKYIAPALEKPISVKPYFRQRTYISQTM